MTAASVTTRASARWRWFRMPGPRLAGSPKVLPAVLGLPVLLWQAVFFAAPLVFLVIVTFWQVKAFRLEPAFVLDNWTRILFSTTFQRALVHTIAVAGTTTVLALLIAFPAAYTIAFRLNARARDLAVAFLIVPVFSSYMLRIYAWQIVLSPEGIINALAGAVGIGPLPLLGGAVSLQVGLLTLTLPIAMLILVFAMAGIDRTLIEAAENLGCRRARVIAHVILPSLRPAIALTATTSFLLAFGDYISPLFMTGSKPPTLSILIVDTVKSGSQWPRASVIGVSMLVMLALVLGLGQWLARGRAARKEAAR
ncbi:ABC-type spermidine/putrescine transport system permease subunit I [Angulomicrobium tetraedrale]|uniref:ABC-type spermidine/putrescine transport system permease subunit I n=1 Tax=Ancylobacter tetraedralis TaxID=217068 RepID=A0A839ZB73_9HYPH|nr:ABC transporter permease [Ancylobacter tetraedralis]MBB3771989.1 ABC-type spermidine/putrescine transport system permease subunit I [Ancylobacter tetraedralis]